MTSLTYVDRARVAEQTLKRSEITKTGALGNLGIGIERRICNLRTRLIAWPGNGYQTQSVHVIHVDQPSDKSGFFRYDTSEQCFVCLSGRAQIWLRGRWVTVLPGDVAYVPEGKETAIRAATSQKRACKSVIVSSISPPIMSHYSEFLRQNGVWDDEKIARAKKAIVPVKLGKSEVRYNSGNSDIRGWNTSALKVRRSGALFNLFRGARFDHGLADNQSPMRFVLFPSFGVFRTGLHCTVARPGQIFPPHVHPISDECVICWKGEGYGNIGGRWVDMKTHDCILAPCQVLHGGPFTDKPEVVFGGLASPPQTDLYRHTPQYFKDGCYTRDVASSVLKS